MTFSYAVIAKRPQLFHRLTGLTLGEFDLLLDKFATQYQLLVINPRLAHPKRLRKPGGGQKGALPGIEDKLFFILVYTRIYPLLIIQGLFFRCAESKACSWVGRLLPVLEATLGSANLTPKRLKGRTLEEIIEAFPELKELGILSDGVERPMHRPKDKEEQKKQYSGKKKRHTKKHVTITHPKTQYILGVSDEHPGRDHDKKIIDDAEIQCRSPIPAGLDSGFAGLSIGEAKIVLPIKRKRSKKGEPKHELTDEQQYYNQSFAKARISVEHSNAGFKRNRSVADILRNTRDGMSDQLTMVAMGLHNLRVTMRASYQKG
jgi:hypothetical protein